MLREIKKKYLDNWLTFELERVKKKKKEKKKGSEVGEEEGEDIGTTGAFYG